MDRALFIGDVHGCADELALLLKECEHTPSDRVVLVGDLVAKGPDSRGVLALVRSTPGMSSVRGNHDEAVIRCREALSRGEPTKAKPVHRDVAESLDDAEFAYLRALAFFERVAEASTIVVHAGMEPGLPVEAQSQANLLSMRSVRQDGTASRRVEDGVPWASRWLGPEWAIFGHDAVRGLQRHPFAIGLDTGCVYGRRLTAWIWPEKRLVSVPARRAYVAAGGRDDE